MTVTNAMRILKQAGIPFDTAEYPVDEEDLSGIHAARALNADPARVFKTIVARGERTGHHVFVIPVAEELDLKKCALAARDKNMELIHVKDLLPLTGYMRGGCSPIGMKKQFPTHIDETAQLFDTVYVSAGKRGQQLVLSPIDLAAFLSADFSDLIVV